MSKGHILVEGQGEVKAVGNLVHRLWDDLGLAFLPWTEPVRVPSINIDRGIRKSLERLRGRAVSAALVLRDEDDDCPKVTGPQLAAHIGTLGFDFPVACVLFHREYETLFLPCIAQIAGKPIIDESGTKRPGVVAGTTFDKDYESLRAVKGWLSRNFPPNKIYKPTLDQLPMTRMLDFPTLRQSELPCFGTLERALHFLDQNRGTSAVYPLPVAE